MAISDREFGEFKAELNSLKERVTKLEAEEARESKEGTIRPGTKRGPKTKIGRTE